jgi:DNA repair protein RadC
MTKLYPKRRKKKYKKPRESAVFGLGLIPKEGVPEIRIRYNRTAKKFLGKVMDPRDAAVFIRKTYPRGEIELQEQFVVLYLNQANEILGYYRHSKGSINSILVDIRLILATALLSASMSIVIAHNHPSGNLSPSDADMRLTKKVDEAVKLLDINLLDHIIISKKDYFSFAEKGFL